VSFNLGKEASMTLTIVDPVTQQSIPIFSLGKLKSFKASPKHETTIIEGVGDGGVPEARDSFHGLDITYSVARRNGILDKVAQVLQDNYYNGGKQVYATFTQTVPNQDGTTDQFQYPKSVLNIKDLGEYAGGGKEVDQNMVAFCPKRTALQIPSVLG
jgi:hypothetical protein